MRHERDCSCGRCQPSSVSDNLLMGLVTLAGVAGAIMSGSKIIVAAVVLLLAGATALKICFPLLGASWNKRGK